MGRRAGPASAGQGEAEAGRKRLPAWLAPGRDAVWQWPLEPFPQSRSRKHQRVVVDRAAASLRSSSARAGLAFVVKRAKIVLFCGGFERDNLTKRCH